MRAQRRSHHLQNASVIRNKILASLEPADLARILPHLVPCRLKFRQRLEQANRKIEQVYFLEDGLASVVAISRYDRRQAEVGMIGFEGMTGLAVVHAAGQSPNETFMQVEGSGYGIAADVLAALMLERPSLGRPMLQYAHVFEILAGHTALANAEGSIEERLARWLLMSHDRLITNILSLTHEFLALMLGVRRPGVTIALQRLEARVEARSGSWIARALRRSRTAFMARPRPNWIEFSQNFSVLYESYLMMA
jgi:CRP-like cAMP-binding protein